MRARRPLIRCFIASCWLLVMSQPAPADDSRYFPPPESIADVANYDDVYCEDCQLGPLRGWVATHPWRNAHVDGYILTDRPSFTNANTTVPAGWAQLESGYQYTYNTNRSGTVISHTQNAPELNLRIGLSSRTELRVLWNGVSLLDVSSPLQDVHRRWSAEPAGRLQIRDQQGKRLDAAIGVDRDGLHPHG